jgi:LysM repeat protein
MPLQKQILTIFALAFSCSFSFAALQNPDAKSEAATDSISTNSKVRTFADNANLPDEVINYGKTFLNRPYRFGSSGADSFDCSGFTSYVYRNFGYNLTHSSSAQANQFDTVKRGNLKKGDLVYFSGSRKSKRIGHVGIVTQVKDNGQFDFIHAANDRGITISSSSEPYYNSRFIKANRVIGGTQLLAANSSITEDPYTDESQDDVEVPMSVPSKKTKKTTPAQYHKVRKGETLADIAEKYSLTVAELKELNHLKSNKIKLKQNLKIKDAETYTEVEPTTVATADNAKADVTKDKVQKEISHKVEKGETLYSIAKKYAVSVAELKENNNIGRRGVSRGQILKINQWVDAEAANEMTALANSQPSTAAIRSLQSQAREEAKAIKVPEYKPAPVRTAANTRIISHKVHAGENLMTIARDFKVPLEDLKQINNMESTGLTVGQTIYICVSINNNIQTASPKQNLPVVLSKNPQMAAEYKQNAESTPEPVIAKEALKEEKNTKQKTSVAESVAEKVLTYTVKPHDNLSAIARQFNLSPAELKRLNGLKSNSLKVGQELTLSSQNSVSVKNTAKVGEKNKELLTTTYVVKRRESLYAIARKHNMTSDELKELNGITNNRVAAGQSIKVYSKSAEKQEIVSPEMTEKPIATTYKVRKGDNLGMIAKKFNLTAEELKQINNLQNNKVARGQVLKVSADVAEIKPSKEAARAEKAKIAKTQPYKVRKGDNLEAIAQQHGMSIDELKELNNLQSNKISVGKSLKVYAVETTEVLNQSSKQEKLKDYATYKVRKGDNLEAIAQKYNMTVDELKEINGISGKKITAGKSIKVYAANVESSSKGVKQTDKPEELASSYKVRKGDNLGSIAKEFNLTVEELKQINNIDGNKIDIGQELKVSRVPESKSAIRQEKVHSLKTKTYIVSKGDNLEVIAKEHEMTIDELKDINGLKGNKISIGQQLKVAAVDANKSSSKGASVEKVEPAKGSSVHTVVKGESLYTIAKQYNITVEELKEMNNLSESGLRPGMELNVKKGSSERSSKEKDAKPELKAKTRTIHHTVKSGESFYTIAQKYDCSVEDIKAWNDKSGSKIKPGDELIIKTKK